MARSYLSPNTGSGLRPAASNSTGPDMHGQMKNPPRMARYGGLNNTRKLSSLSNAPTVRRPGFEK